MALNKSLSSSSTHRSSHHGGQEFWQQLEEEFAFKNVDEDQLRQQTEQWITCASELLGPPPFRSKQKTKR